MSMRWELSSQAALDAVRPHSVLTSPHTVAHLFPETSPRGGVMRHVLLSIALALVVCHLSSPAFALTAEETNLIRAHEAVMRSVVLVLVWGGNSATQIESGELLTNGSGVAIEEGLVLTNYHVVEAASRIEVLVPGGEKVGAVLVGTAPGLDLALLRVPLDAERLPPAGLGRGSDLRTGQTILAVGSPFGFDHSVTSGIVSGLNREFPGLEFGPALIQFDAAINPGQSGGALADSEGRVVGLITAKVLAGEALGFAIPMELATRVVPELKRMGHAFRPQLGFSGFDINLDLARLFDLPSDTGLLVEEVDADSPAERGGLTGGDRHVVLGDKEYVLGGDIVIGLNGTRIHASAELMLHLLALRPGDRFSLEVLSASGTRTVELTVPPMSY